ncbi:unnamed protein product [Macrosiphum euphorbiae]|uniref:C2H2-type domain-containing protein n=1 Tax=Macrosiphum euphorbiae TaxID=13131 RepID=A0AAV0WL96_9HEMI|nr:unnamed protein product [Macrosiphum euphorbiae]
MTSMKDCLQVEVTGDADAVTSELYLENTIENSALYTVEDNHVSLVYENVEKCIELETDMMDDFMWGRRIKITKEVANQSNMELPLEYQDYTDNINLNPGNTSDIMFHCNICGKSFDYNYLLKIHMAEHKKQVHYKTNKCKFCGKQFKLKFGLNRHIQKHHNSMCATIVSTAPHTNIPNNDIISYPGQTKIISNTLERNVLDQINLANSKESIVLTASQNSMANILSIKQKKDLFTNVREINSSDEVDSVNSNESALANKPHDLMVKQFPTNTANNSIVSIVRDTPYFCIRKSSNIEHGFRNDDYDQTLQNKLIFTCRICKNPPSTDIHSFALHMSDHRECKMHECIVCDKTFNSVVLWTDHMTYHQQQIDLNVSTVQFNLFESEFNTFHTNNVNIELEPNVIQNNISIEDNNTDSATTSIKKTNYCNLCDRKFRKHCYFTNHMMIRHKINTNTPKQLTSIDCNESTILSENIELTNESENKLSVPVNNKNYSLNNHVNKSNEKKSTFCILCNKHFAHLGALTNHMRIHVEHPCGVCEKKFSTKLKLNLHQKSHSKLKIDSIGQDIIKCRYCKKECNSIFQWKNHMSKECRRHCKSYLPKFTSNKTYLNTGSQKSKLMDIIQQKPAIIKKRNRSNHINGAKCELCGKIYCNKYNLTRHVSVVHKKTYKPVTCNVCGITLKNKFSYEEHLRVTHKQLFKHYEGTNSTKKRTSEQIISVNTENVTYTCRMCGTRFSDIIAFKKHAKIHTSDKYTCNDCGQQYETNLALSNHIWENHS